MLGRVSVEDFVGCDMGFGPRTCPYCLGSGQDDLSKCEGCGGTGKYGLDWVIAGGETGPGARPMHPDWLRGLRDQCAAAGVPFLLKQWGDYQNGSAPKVPPVCVYHDGRSVPATPKAIKAEERRSGISHDRVGNNPVIMSRVGKRAAGRLLDGCTHDAYPQEAA